MQADNLNAGLPQVVIAMITSNLSRREHPSRVWIPLNSPMTTGSGLLTDSIIMTDNLATALEKAIVGKLGHLADMKPVNAALRATPGLQA